MIKTLKIRSEIMNNHIFKRVISAMLTSLVVFSSFASGIVAQEYSVANDYILPDTTQYQRRIDVSLVSDIVTEGTTFNVALLPEQSFADYYFVTDGISVIAENSKSKNISFSLQTEEEFGRLEVFIDFGDGNYQRQCIYTYNASGKTFISDLAEDDAWRKGLSYKYENEIITEAELEVEYGTLSRRWLETVNSLASPESVTNVFGNEQGTGGGPSYVAGVATVDGTLGWYAGPNNTLWQPLKCVWIELRREWPLGSLLIANGQTDEYGHYEFTFNDNNYSVFLRIFPESDSFKVMDVLWPFSGIGDYRIDTQAVSLNGSSTTLVPYNVQYNKNVLTNKAYYVCQGMVAGQRYAEAMGVSNSYIDVVYPYYPNWPLVGMDTSFCNPEWGIIGIVGDSWESFDTLMHEYGHFVQYRKGIDLGEFFLDISGLLSDKYSHYPDADHLYDKAQYGKDFAMRLTYVEAWATVFAQIAQEELGDYSTVPGVGDRKHNGDPWNGLTMYSPDANKSGEGQEFAVEAFLISLYDLLGNQSYWSATTQSGTNTLSILTQILDSQYSSYRNQIGAALGARQIAPSNFTITNASTITSATPPAFSWKGNGSYANPNNAFELRFYDSSENLKYTLGVNVYPPPDNTVISTYTLSTSEWSTVRSKFPAG
ncbi:MAG: hypothetical protein FWH42_06255, partial [Dehalococcoidia bacterium]|nr:hypothetical protein [Dehalococcoidia bacterium]